MLRFNKAIEYGFLGVSYFFCAFFASLYSSRYSRDASQYRWVFESIANGDLSFDNYGRLEFLYYIWNWLFGIIGLKFEAFLFVSTLIFLCIKISVLNTFSQNSNKLRILLLYFLILFLLHESIQYKIAWAISISLWSCNFFYRGKWLLGVIFSIIAFGFHPSSILLSLVFLFILWLVIRYNLKYNFLLPIFITLILFIIIKISVPLISSIDVRYLEYLDENRLNSQNSSGLFYYYTAYISLILALVTCYIKKTNVIMRITIIISYISVLILYLFSPFICIASRISDIFLVFIIPVTSNSLNANKSYYFSSVVYLLLSVLFFARIYWLWL